MVWYPTEHSNLETAGCSLLFTENDLGARVSIEKRGVVLGKGEEEERRVAFWGVSPSYAIEGTVVSVTPRQYGLVTIQVGDGKGVSVEIENAFVVPESSPWYARVIGNGSATDDASREEIQGWLMYMAYKSDYTKHTLSTLFERAQTLSKKQYDKSVNTIDITNILRSDVTHTLHHALREENSLRESEQQHALSSAGLRELSLLKKYTRVVDTAAESRKRMGVLVDAPNPLGGHPFRCIHHQSTRAAINHYIRTSIFTSHETYDEDFEGAVHVSGGVGLNGGVAFDVASGLAKYTIGADASYILEIRAHNDHPTLTFDQERLTLHAEIWTVDTLTETMEGVVVNDSAATVGTLATRVAYSIHTPARVRVTTDSDLVVDAVGPYGISPYDTAKDEDLFLSALPALDVSWRQSGPHIGERVQRVVDVDTGDTPIDGTVVRYSPSSNPVEASWLVQYHHDGSIEALSRTEIRQSLRPYSVSML